MGRRMGVESSRREHVTVQFFQGAVRQAREPPRPPRGLRTCTYGDGEEGEGVERVIRVVLLRAGVGVVELSARSSRASNWPKKKIRGGGNLIREKKRRRKKSPPSLPNVCQAENDANYSDNLKPYLTWNYEILRTKASRSAGTEDEENGKNRPAKNEESSP